MFEQCQLMFVTMIVNGFGTMLVKWSVFAKFTLAMNG